MSEFNPQQILTQKEITIPFADLNPHVQQVIEEINLHRSERATGEFLMGIALAAYSKGLAAVLSGGLFGVGFGRRGWNVGLVQKKHAEIREKEKLLRSDRENTYPRDWIHINEITKTHPIFYVKGNRDLVLVKNSRMEYFRYRVQHEYLKGTIGLFGLNPWRWRGYLQPPTAPVSVKKWANDKLKKMMKAYNEKREQKRREREERRPAPQPGFTSMRTRARAVFARRTRRVRTA